VQSYGGQNDLTFWQGKVLSLGFGQGEDVVMNSGYETVATVKGGNGLQADLHDFQIAPGNVAYVTAYNPIHCDLASAQGPSNGVILDAVIEEIDMKTGLVRWEWHSLDHVRATTPRPRRRRAPHGTGSTSTRSTRSPMATSSSRRATPGPATSLGRDRADPLDAGGLRSSFKMGAGTKTWWQHDGRILADGDVTFSTTARTRLRKLSHAACGSRLTSRLTRRDWCPPTPTRTAAARGEPGQHADAGGRRHGRELRRHPADQRVPRGGSLLFDAHLSYAMTSYRGFRFPWSGRPVSPPAALAS